MGASLSVFGIREPDDKFRKMKAIWDACQEAGVEPPDEVFEFFNDETPDPAGVKIYLDPGYMDRGDGPNKYGLSLFSRDGEQGYELDLTQLPKDLKRLRFTLSH